MASSEVRGDVSLNGEVIQKVQACPKKMYVFSPTESTETLLREESTESLPPVKCAEVGLGSWDRLHSTFFLTLTKRHLPRTLAEVRSVRS